MHRKLDHYKRKNVARPDFPKKFSKFFYKQFDVKKWGFLAFSREHVKIFGWNFIFFNSNSSPYFYILVYRWTQSTQSSSYCLDSFMIFIQWSALPFLPITTVNHQSSCKSTSKGCCKKRCWMLIFLFIHKHACFFFIFQRPLRGVCPCKSSYCDKKLLLLLVFNCVIKAAVMWMRWVWSELVLVKLWSYKSYEECFLFYTRLFLCCFSRRSF